MLVNIGDVIYSSVKKETYVVLGYDKDFYRDGSQFYIDESYEEYLKFRYLTVNYKLLKVNMDEDTYDVNVIKDILNKQINIDDVLTIASKRLIKKIGHIDIDLKTLILKNMIMGTILNIYTKDEFEYYVKEYYASCSNIPLKEVTEVELGRLYKIDNKIYACIGFHDKKKVYVLGYLGDAPYGLANRDRVNIVSLNKTKTLWDDITSEKVYEYPSRYTLVKQHMKLPSYIKTTKDLFL